VFEHTKVWLVGATGFTGKYLLPMLQAEGYVVDTKKIDITDAQTVESHILQIKPDYIINLAGISFVPDGGDASIYAINTFGPQNILNACLNLEKKPRKIILASSSHIYGEQKIELIDESCQANPINHYGCSKLAMEQMAKTYQNKLNILITRPFNYTGCGQSDKFLIPKIIQQFKEKKSSVSLGNIDIWRDFSDVRWIAKMYMQLLKSSQNEAVQVVNLCSEKLVSIRDIIYFLQDLSQYTIKIEINPDFVRASDLKKQRGSSARLNEILGPEVELQNIKDTLQWMLNNKYD